MMSYQLWIKSVRIMFEDCLWAKHESLYPWTLHQVTWTSKTSSSITSHCTQNVWLEFKLNWRGCNQPYSTSPTLRARFFTTHLFRTRDLISLTCITGHNSYTYSTMSKKKHYGPIMADTCKILAYPAFWNFWWDPVNFPSLVITPPRLAS